MRPATPAGLKLVDTRTWTVRTLDPGTGLFAVAGRLLLAHGFGRGLTAYDREGNRLWHRFGSKTIGSVEANETRVYVYRYVERRSWIEDPGCGHRHDAEIGRCARFQLLRPGETGRR
jgi:hypothetical protein